MKITKALPADVNVIAPLFDLYRQFYQRTSDPEAAREFLSARLKNGESVIFIARDEERVHGFAQLYPTFSSISLVRMWILNDVFVRPESRRHSVGRLLLERAAEFADETRSRGLTLKTAVDNRAAQKLYESAGWKRDDRFCSYDLKLTTG